MAINRYYILQKAFINIEKRNSSALKQITDKKVEKLSQYGLEN